MKHTAAAAVAAVAVVALSACAGTTETKGTSEAAPRTLSLFPGETAAVRRLVDKWADHYDVPRTLVHRVIQRESDYRARARNGPYWGMMQILPATARNMGFDGDPARLLDADTALKYSVRYLRGAWMVADGDEHAAMMWYARGFYHEARDRGLLRQTGLRGPLWDQYDAGLRDLPPIDAAGNLLPPAPPCQPRTGLARALHGTGCPA